MKRAIYDHVERLRLVVACQRADVEATAIRRRWSAIVRANGQHQRGAIRVNMAVCPDDRSHRVHARADARRTHRALEAFDKRERQARIGVALAALDLGACGHALTVRE